MKYVIIDAGIRPIEYPGTNFPPNKTPYLFIKYEGIIVKGKPAKKKETTRTKLNTNMFSTKYITSKITI